MTKEERKLYQREYRKRGKDPLTPTISTTTVTVDNVNGLKQRIENWNIAQQVKKQELGLLPNIWSSNNVGMYRQRFYALQGNETGLDQMSREQIVRLSRELFFQLPGIGVASEMKAQYVVGNHWKFEYKGKNEAWGKVAEHWVNEQWFNNCTTKGFAYPFSTMLKVLSRTLDMDGDSLMLFTRDKYNFPLLQFIGSHRVGSTNTNYPSRDNSLLEVNGKKYQCLDGVVYDEIGKPIYWNIKRDDAQITTWQQDPKTEQKDTLVSVNNAQLVMDPLVFDKGRGLPSLYSCVLFGLQIEDLHAFLMDIAKIEATIAMVVKNDLGQAPQEYENLLNQIQSAGNLNSALPAVAPTVHGLSIIKQPTINYAKADGGELQSFKSDRPSEQIQNYIRDIETKLLSAIGIPHQIIYSPETISGRAVNAVTQMVRQTVSHRQNLLRRYAKLAVSYALSVAMEEGMIPKNYDEDIDSIIHFTKPPEFTLDINQDNSTNLDLYKVGLISGEQYCARNDTNFKQICQKREKEINELLSYVENTKKLYPDMNESTILNLYTQRGQSTVTIEDPMAQPSVAPKINDGKSR